MKDYFEGRPAEDTMPPAPQRSIILPWCLWALVVGFVIGAVLYSSKVSAGPVGQVTTPEGVRVVFYTEPCALTEFVTNLPYRAVWEESGKTFEGCYLVRSEVGLVVAYFADKTVGLIPLRAVRSVTGA